ncbi:hypothetical protein M3O96_19090 [Aquiflexum sp. TKW24L]|uniref:hypothetical protein n=1 Tax=Aquiflexum sp. TKW24L TaxID=2942212 RepID=UPI0020BD6186|nr:hypothetical protein [Aquiflexum sp. TKW24L]MCL6261215.1 hypothetical protein [Aquiflexum sp. TKW24L]
MSDWSIRQSQVKYHASDWVFDIQTPLRLVLMGRRGARVVFLEYVREWYFGV